MFADFNYVIRNKFYEQEKDLLIYLFGNDDVAILDEPVDMYDILVKSGVFKSKSEARKNWSKTGKEIPSGYCDFTGIGKNKTRITIFNPVDTSDKVVVLRLSR